ncbi:MAG: aminotransferase class I/II-fold pyridoxal phosphate-dependent enzyme [Pedococcus sp.]
MDDHPVSARSVQIQQAESFRMLFDFARKSGYQERRLEPGVLDFTFGDPHETPQPDYVEALREAALPKDELWFAYKFSQESAQAAAADSLSRHLGVTWPADRIRMTTGGFGAIATSLKSVADPGDEVIFSLPPWFLYESLALEAGLVPVKVRIDPQTFDLDLVAIEAAITPRTRVVIVNTPNNPTGRVYPEATLRVLAALLDDASARHGRRIYLISDEPYNRLVFDGARFVSPAQFYTHTLLCYSYGKTLLSPGQRLGYLALPPSMPQDVADAVIEAVESVQIAAGWLFPNNVMQYATPRLEELSIDVAHLQAKRDFMVEGLRALGYELATPEATFYLFPHSPVPDDESFVRLLSDLGVLVMPGRIFETPGFFRICITATMESIEASLPRFATALTQARGG